MTEPKGGRRKLTGHARIHLSVIVRRVARRQGTQAEPLHRLSAHDQRQPFVVQNVLDFRNDYLPRLVEHNLVAPMAIQIAENGGHSIVFAHENRVQRGQRDDLIGSAVT